jgi:hypothetical protein
LNASLQSIAGFPPANAAIKLSSAARRAPASAALVAELVLAALVQDERDGVAA